MTAASDRRPVPPCANGSNDIITGPDVADPPPASTWVDSVITEFTAGEAAAYAAVTMSIGGRTFTSSRLGLSMSDGSSPSFYGNIAHLRGPLRDDDHRLLADALISFFGAGPGGPFLFFAPWPTGDLGRAGFTHAGNPPLMVRTGDQPDPEAVPLEIREVRDPDDLAIFERTLISSYPVPGLEGSNGPGVLLGPGVLATGWRFFVGYEDGRPVATSAVFPTESLAVVEMISTRADRRGNGFGAAMTEVVCRCDNTRTAALLASDLGRPVYERLGFVTVARQTLWIGSR